jgi:hypothetical protein
MAQESSTALDFQERMPAARLTGLVMSEVGNETVVYDTEHHHIHHLNPTSAAVWQLLDGRRTVRELVRDARMHLGTDVAEEVVQAAVIQLYDAHLVDGPLPARLRLTGQSRRRFLKRAAVVGVGAGAAIVSVTAPTAAQTASGCTNTCGPNNSNCCTCTGGVLRAIVSGCVSLNAQGGALYVAACATACVGL